MEIIRWDQRDLATQKSEYDKQLLAWRFREAKGQWARNYARLARAMADTFGEEEVLDLLEQTWWDLEFEGGSTWREESLKAPVETLELAYHLQHDGSQSLTTGPQDVRFIEERWELIHYFCYLKEVFMSLNERKIGISWCMGDAAAVRGLHPNLVLDFVNSQLRGDPFCYHVRRFVENPDPSWDHWSRELSEKIGWRSIKKLEET